MAQSPGCYFCAPVEFPVVTSEEDQLKQAVKEKTKVPFAERTLESGAFGLKDGGNHWKPSGDVNSLLWKMASYS